MLALYRKYRPQRFSEIYGQEAVKTSLRREVETGSIAHAYVFTGPRGTGKTSTARILAAALNCAKPDKGEPCTLCQSCLSIRQGTFLDLIEIDAASQTGVDNVRANIIETARFSPQAGAYRVYIIDEAHMLSLSAWNALLKTLEEPPAHALFILATTEVRKIPDTILSRCQHFRFRPLDADTLKARLEHLLKQEKATADEDVLNEIVTRAQGYVRDAESLLGQCLSLGERTLTLQSVKGILEKSPIEELCAMAEHCLKGDAPQALALLHDLETGASRLDQLFYDFLDVLRAAHFYRLTGSDHPQFARRYGAVGLALVRGMLNSQVADVGHLRAALTAAMSRLPLLRTAPAGLCFELVLSEIASLTLPPGLQQIHTKQIAWSQESKPAPAEAELKKNAQSANPAPITLEDVRRVWHNVLALAQVRNRALPSILSFARVLKVDQPNLVHIGFHYRFHIEHLHERRLGSVIEEIMSACVGSPVRLSYVLLGSDAVGEANDPSLSQVLDMFGGKLVEE